MSLFRRTLSYSLCLVRRRNPFANRLPHRVKLTTYVAEGCVFEVTTPVEEARVLRFGEEPDFLRLVLDDIKPGERLFDVGSCVGLYALHAARRGAKVVAFEPDPGYRARLNRNIEINRLADRIRVVDWAVSDSKGTAVLYTDGVEGRSPSLALVGERGSVAVSTDSIDCAISAGSLPIPDIVKLDIEEPRYLALRGMAGLLRSDRAPRCLFIELHPTFLEAFHSSVQDCVDIVESSGYKKATGTRGRNRLIVSTGRSSRSARTRIGPPFWTELRVKTDRLEILSASLLDVHRGIVEEMRQTTGQLGLGLGWHYLLDLSWSADMLQARPRQHVMDAGGRRRSDAVVAGRERRQRG